MIKANEFVEFTATDSVTYSGSSRDPETGKRYSRIFPKKTRDVPVWARFSSGVIRCVNRHKSTHVLAEVVPRTDDGISTLSRGWLSVEDRSVKAIIYDVLDLRCYYVETGTDVRALHPHVKRNLSVAFSAVPVYYYNAKVIRESVYWSFGCDKTRLVMKHVTPPVKGEFERADVSSEHHTHYRPEELYGMMGGCTRWRKTLCNNVLYRLRKINGATEGMVSSFVAYMLTAPIQSAFVLATCEALHTCRDVGELIKHLKKSADPMKVYQSAELSDLSSPVSYTHLTLPTICSV